MSIYSASNPPLPSLQPHPEYSFYPYPINPRTQLHSTLQSSSSSSSSSRSSSIRGLNPPRIHDPLTGTIGESSSSNSHTRSEERALRRAEKRAVKGWRPAGVGLGREADDLSEEEAIMEDEKRFLLPIGRRQTQMEMDNAHSPTPSEADHDRRQEDQHGAEMASPPPPMLADEDEGEEEDDGPGGELDLDASMEDLDGDMDDLDNTMEDGMDGDEDDE